MRVDTRLQLVQGPLHPDLQESLVTSLVPEARAATRPGRRLLVVPSRALGLHLARATARRHGALVGLRSLTWLDLALLLTSSERGARGRRFLGREATTWLVRRLRTPDARAPGVFDRLLEVRGFRKALLHTFEELGRAGLATAAGVERLLLRRAFELPLRLRHLLELYLAYRRSFEAKHDDTWSVLAQAGTGPTPSLAEACGSHELWVYGFQTLGVLEQRILTRLVTDPGTVCRVFVPRSSPTQEPKLVRALASLGFETKRAPSTEDEGTTPETCVLSTAGEEAQAREIARELLAAADSGLGPAEMAVVSRTRTPLVLLRETIERCGLPCRMPSGQSLRTCRSGRALLLFLDLLDSDFIPETVLDFLHMAPIRWRDWSDLDAVPVPSAWTRTARETGLGPGLDDWKRKLERRSRELEERALLLETDDEPTRRTNAALGATRELLLVAKTLAGEIDRVPVRGSWNAFTQTVLGFLDRAFEPGPETDALRSALERLRALDTLGTGPVSRSDFRDAVRQALVESTLRDETDETQPAIELGTLQSFYGRDLPLVCVVGLEESAWPGPERQDPVLPEEHRDVLRRVLDLELRDVDRGEDEKRLFFAATGGARRRLVLAYSRLDPATGTERLPSSVLLELAEEREQRQLDYTGFERLPWVERIPPRRTRTPQGRPLLSVSEFDEIVVAGLDRREARRYLTRLGPRTHRGWVLDLVRNHKRRFTIFDGMLESEAARAPLERRFGARPLSATQLATYATCPFRFFMRHVLGLEPLDRDEGREVSALEIGRLVHTILERFYRDLASEGFPSLERLSEEDCKSRLLVAAEACFEELEERGLVGARLLWSVRKQRLREDLLRFLRAERARDPVPWVPQAFETRFGPGTGRSVRVEIGGGHRVELRGRIDRIDARPGQDAVRVVDYKSGRALQGAEATTQAIQLLVYLAAATGAKPERLATSEARFLYVTRRGRFAMQRLPGSVLAERYPDFEHLVRVIAQGIRGGVFLPNPGPGALHCTGCDYERVCDARVAEQAETKSRSGQARFLVELPSFAADLDHVRDGVVPKEKS